MAEFYRKKKKICQMCAGKSVDYKDVMIINKYINEEGLNGKYSIYIEIDGVIYNTGEYVEF